MGPGLLPRDGVRQAQARPQLVDHGQECERAGVQGPWRALLADEGRLALGQAFHFLEEFSQPTPQPVGEGAEVNQAPPVHPLSGGLHAGDALAQAEAV